MSLLRRRLRLLKVLQLHPTLRLHASEIAERAGMPGAEVHTDLVNLQDEGWIESALEEQDSGFRRRLWWLK